jgi:integrase
LVRPRVPHGAQSRWDHGLRSAFHDARHGSLTNGAANGESTFALMRRAGHKNVATTQRYVDLAGVVFRDEADALEDRDARGLESSTHLSRSHLIWHHLKPLKQAGFRRT